MVALSKFQFPLRSTFLTVAAALLIAGCFQSPTEGAVVGGAIGAGTGAAIGSASGNAGYGAAIGGTAGAVAGAAIGSGKDDTKKASEKEQQDFMRRQAEAMQKQQDELDDLRRQRYHDEYLRQEYEVGEAERAE
jgi:osmotically inducible lipoprotein OsmB